MINLSDFFFPGTENAGCLFKGGKLGRFSFPHVPWERFSKGHWKMKWHKYEGFFERSEVLKACQRRSIPLKEKWKSPLFILLLFFAGNTRNILRQTSRLVSSCRETPVLLLTAASLLPHCCNQGMCSYTTQYCISLLCPQLSLVSTVNKKNGWQLVDESQKIKWPCVLCRIYRPSYFLPWYSI